MWEKVINKLIELGIELEFNNEENVRFIKNNYGEAINENKNYKKKSDENLEKENKR